MQIKNIVLTFGVNSTRAKGGGVVDYSALNRDWSPAGGGGESLIKDLERKANSLSHNTRQASALGLEV